MKQYALLSILVVALLFAGCVDGPSGDADTKEILAKTLIASKNMDSYSANTKMFLTMDVKSEEMSGEFMESEITQNSKVDSKNKRFYSKAEMVSSIMGSSVEAEIEEYAIGDYVYTKHSTSYDYLPPEWEKEQITSSDFSWNEVEEFQEVMDLMQDSTVEYLRKEDIAGQSYHVIKVTPDKKELIGMSDVDAVGGGSDLIGDMHITIWVNEDNHYTEKVEMYMSLFIEEEEGSMSGEVTLEMDINEINQPMDITLPAEVTP